jgi:hypothetical protein
MLSYIFNGICGPRLSLCAIVLLAAAKTVVSAERAVLFEQEIAPILEKACNECHAGKETRGELRLDSRTAALKGGFSGPGLVPHSAENSLIYQRITSSDPDLRMPNERKPLSETEIALIRSWIDSGADWPDAL